MNRPGTLFILTMTILSMVAVSAQQPASKATREIERRAAEIHRKALVIDTHLDTLQRVLVRGADLG